jgi:hypothetical protein
MKKGANILLFIFALWTAISGIADSDIHVITSVIFTLLMCVHAFQYRKFMVICFRGLGWKWALITLVLIVMIFTSFVD